MEEDKGWCVDFVKCDICTNTWLAVYHEDCDRLECPNCENIVNVEIITKIS